MDSSDSIKAKGYAAPGAPADHGRRTGPAWRRHRGGSPELGQLVAMELGFLWGFTVRDRGDEVDLLHLPRGNDRWQRRSTSTGQVGPSLVTSGAASGGPPTTRKERADSPHSPLAPWPIQLLQEMAKDRIRDTPRVRCVFRLAAENSS
jgi:hypothetical protein